MRLHTEIFILFVLMTILVNCGGSGASNLTGSEENGSNGETSIDSEENTIEEGSFETSTFE